MVAAGWVPEAGDIVWIQFDRQAGHEQSGHRPALVLSHSSYNLRAGLAVFCPITTRIKGLRFEVTLSGDPKSVVLADHVKSLDWRARSARPKDVATAAELNEVRGKLRALLGF